MSFKGANRMIFGWTHEMRSLQLAEHVTSASAAPLRGILCGYVAVWLCGSVAMQLCSYVAICGYVAMWLGGPPTHAVFLQA